MPSTMRSSTRKTCSAAACRSWALRLAPGAGPSQAEWSGQNVSCTWDIFTVIRWLGVVGAADPKTGPVPPSERVQGRGLDDHPIHVFVWAAVTKEHGLKVFAVGGQDCVERRPILASSPRPLRPLEELFGDRRPWHGGQGCRLHLTRARRWSFRAERNNPICMRRRRLPRKGIGWSGRRGWCGWQASPSMESSRWRGPGCPARNAQLAAVMGGP